MAMIRQMRLEVVLEKSETVYFHQPRRMPLPGHTIGGRGNLYCFQEYYEVSDTGPSQSTKVREAFSALGCEDVVAIPP